MDYETWGHWSPVETDSGKREFDSGNLTVGRITFQPRQITVTRKSGETFGGFPDGEAFGGFPYHPARGEDMKVHEKALDADEIARAYETHVVQVDKRTHRIRFENETEHEVTLIVEPKT